MTEYKQGDRVRVTGFEARVDYVSSSGYSAYLDLTTGDGNLYCVPRSAVELIPPRAEDDPVGSVRKSPTGLVAVKVRPDFWAVLDQTTTVGPTRWTDETANQWAPTGEKILLSDE